MNNELLSFKNISHIKNNKEILKNIDLQIEKNQNWVFLGRNGSGKTTLLHLIYGMEWPSYGSLYFKNLKYGEISIQKIREQIQIIDPTTYFTTLQKNLTVQEIILTGFFNTVGFYKNPTTEELQKSEAILIDNHLFEKKDQLFSSLSSGEKNKILFLKFLIQKTELLLLDEPCSAFDFTAREEFFEFLNSHYLKYKFTSIYVTHRLEEIPEFYSHILLLKEGRILLSGKIEQVLTSENLSELYERKCNLEKIKNRYFIY